MGTEDLMVLLAMWGECGEDDPCFGDLDENGAVDTEDLLVLLGNWGPCPEE